MATQTPNQRKAEELATKMLNICRPIIPIMLINKEFRDNRLAQIKEMADQILAALDQGVDVTLEDLLYSNDGTCGGGEGPPPS